MSGRVLVFGASGKFASLIVPALRQKGVEVPGFAHGENAAARARSTGANEVAVGDLTDRTSVDDALNDVECVFYLAPVFMPDEAETGRSVVAACRAAGVRRFVFSSIIHPVLAGLSNHAAKAPVEEAVLDSGLEYTFLHPALFFQNYAESWTKVVETGTLAEPYSCDTRFSRVDYRDVAEAAAIALTEDRLLYGTFELCADGWLNRHDVAALMGEALGRTVGAARIDPDTLADAPEPMKAMFRHYDHIGLRGNSLTLRAILGREPRSLRAFFAELAASG